MEKKRFFYYDNLRAILIFLVVFGHMIENMPGALPRFLYVFIYFFHIPLFIFLSGMFARFNPKRILSKLVWPYVITQLLYYLCFSPEQEISFTKPYWALWYVFAMCVYSVLIPAFEAVGRKKRKVWLIIGLTLLGVLVGFDKQVGYYLSLSRIIVYSPFFVAGLYMDGDWLMAMIEKCRGWFMALGGALCVALVFCYQYIEPQWLYNSMSFADSNMLFLFRILFYAIAVAFSLGIMSICPKGESLVSKIGKRTILIYLGHIFIIKYLDMFELRSWLNTVTALIAATAIVLFLYFVQKGWNLCQTRIRQFLPNAFPYGKN